jgi:hypothetical protein
MHEWKISKTEAILYRKILRRFAVLAASSILTVHQCRDEQTGNAPAINQIHFEIFHQSMQKKIP